MAVRSSLIEKNVDLAPYNTLNIHATARYFAHIETREALKLLLTDDEDLQQPTCILGGGSNILFVGDFEGLIIHIAIGGRQVKKEDPENVWLTVGAGENWHRTVQYCIRKGWGGVENLSLIPGTVGAAPIQNIGAYGVELQDVFEQLTAVEMKSGRQRTFNREQCEFAYRDSIFKNELKGQFVVTDVTLKLSKKPQLNTSYGAIRRKLDEKNITDPSIADISEIVIGIRNSKLPNPAEIANAGSFFKNPVVCNSIFDHLKQEYPSIPGFAVDENHVKVPAGWLIEQTGWKGRRAGKAGTYRQQALVIINYGGANGKEILNLSRKIQQSVQETFGIELIPEVNIVG